MPENVCNYALIRFLPYRDAGEFVNIGVALACAPAGFLDFRIETRRYARVSHFFPELDIRLYHEGLRALRGECDRWRDSAARLAQRRPDGGTEIMRHIFGEMTRARESVFHLGTPRTMLTDQDPAVALDGLFDHYVRRQFVAEPAHGEEALRQRIAQSLREFGLERFYRPARIGTPDYHVQMPFVASEEVSESPSPTGQPVFEVARTVLKAIKPLDLDRDEPSEITQHGDEWISRVRRLRETSSLPPQMLFPVQVPTEEPRRITAAAMVRHDLEELGATTITFGDAEQLLHFARLEYLN